ncbi:MAG: CHAT domain-containing tetratricopeptide repeat protein, partial [Pseudomonadota bacterium]
IGRAKFITGAYKDLVELYLETGNLEMAKRRLDEGTALCIRLSNPRFPGARWHDGNHQSMRAHFLEAEGRFSLAEPLRRKAIKSYQELAASASSETLLWNDLAFEHISLINNLIQQGRILEAEMEARKILKKSIEYFGKGSYVTGTILSILGDILMREGRLHDAEEITRMGIRNITDMGLPGESYFLCRARVNLGNILTGKKEYRQAMQEFDQASRGFTENHLFYQKLLKTNPNTMLAMIETGRFQEVSEKISGAYGICSTFFGENHALTAEIKGLRGFLNYRLKKYEEALKDFSSALPVLIGSGSQTESDYLKRQTVIAILEAYLNLLKEMGENQALRQVGGDIEGQSFRIADVLMGRSVSSALAESSARAAVTDKDLADLIRREQDAFKEIKVLGVTLANIAATPGDQQNKVTAENLRNRMERLINARASLLKEIQTRFPRYTDLTNPRPATLENAQANLLPDEALIVIYPTERETYIWCVPHKGVVRFAYSKWGRKDLSRIVTDLRRSLAPDPSTFGDIPAFDVRMAHELYVQLLKPVEEGWMQAKDLLVVAPGILGQLPFSVLLTSPVTLQEGRGDLFSEYRQVPWLVRKVSLTRYPAASSFITLRSLPKGDLHRKAFVGFGDPLFTPDQSARSKTSDMKLASRGGDRVHVRGIRVAGGGKIDDSKKIYSMSLSDLNRLPDTSQEIKDVAAALGANPETDTFTGVRASEHQVKTMDLSDRRVIAFASHALLPWDLDGLDQPAIALSAPSVTGDGEDGLLTMGEIMKLRLNADWVVLSACNTGASEGEGAEAVSGLGRAFFYAGTRAVLVTMWPVETTSARSLMTGLFRHYSGQKGLSRAQAQRRSIYDMIDSRSLKDTTTGRTIATYAHPFFWAPFIIMGDGS